ncbi:MAG: hypothetical protein KAU20_04650, partial [Nanoarchaeota archaeon]|nr:hypothetical protein [Nanoarchaeota archaeon]
DSCSDAAGCAYTYNTARCGSETELCWDESIAVCSSACDGGSCAVCTPECPEEEFLAPEEEISAEEKEGMFTCINITKKIKDNIALMASEIDKSMIPKGYSIIIEPFNLDCSGESMMFTLAIPDNYIDVKALKCRAGKCHEEKVEYVTELWCGEDIESLEYIKEVKRKTTTLKPEVMPIMIKEVKLNITELKQSIESGDNKVKFYGKEFEGLAKLSMPSKEVEEAKNPYLRIIGTPLVLEFDKKVEKGVNTEITMPYILSDGFEESSIAVYAKKGEKWDYIGGEIDYENKIVKADVENIHQYLNDENKAVLVLMGILSGFGYNSSLDLVYNPEKSAKDALILVHGIASSPVTYQPIIDDIRLTKQPIAVYTFSYPFSNMLNKTSKELSNLLEAKTGEYDNIHIVAHSLGGLIAQQALYHAHEQKNAYLGKVGKVILVATPNEGSPVAGVYKNLFVKMVNEKTEYPLFNINSRVMDDLVKGVITPRIPGVDYYVIAGTRIDEVNMLFFRISAEKLFGEYEKADGIITTKSAQHVGDGYINDKCSNYWEINLTHGELVSHPVARKVIENIIAKDILKIETLLGNSRYFELNVNDCDSRDIYVLIGKEIRKEEIEDATFCRCGNGYCGVGENAYNCP